MPDLTSPPDGWPAFVATFSQVFDHTPDSPNVVMTVALTTAVLGVTAFWGALVVNTVRGAVRAARVRITNGARERRES